MLPDHSNCAIGGGFNYSSPNPDATPTQQPGNVGTAQFDCIIPRAAQGAPARASLYGHGLLGSRTEVHAGNVQNMASEHDFVFCATDWWGLASADTLFDVSALQNLNQFPAVVDRLQQGVVNTLLLGRLMANPDGFASDAAFRQNGNPLFDTSHLYYDGNSQGGIMGGITTAVAPDYTRAVLGVTGMDYGGILLQRSTDFTPFATFLYGRGAGRRLHGRVDPPADTRPHAAALGSRRGRRLRGTHHLRPASRHTRPQGADAHRLRRPPGEPVCGGRRGADDRRPGTRSRRSTCRRAPRT